MSNSTVRYDFVSSSSTLHLIAGLIYVLFFFGYKFHNFSLFFTKKGYKFCFQLLYPAFVLCLFFTPEGICFNVMGYVVLFVIIYHHLHHHHDHSEEHVVIYRSICLLLIFGLFCLFFFSCSAASAPLHSLHTLLCFTITKLNHFISSSHLFLLSSVSAFPGQLFCGSMERRRLVREGRIHRNKNGIRSTQQMSASSNMGLTLPPFFAPPLLSTLYRARSTNDRSCT